MMKISKILLLSVLSLASLVSCKKDEGVLIIPVLTVTPTKINVAAEDVTASFQVKSNATWTVTCADSWVKSFTKTGSGNGTVKVDFTVNTDSQSERRADILVAVAGKTAKVILTQGKAGIEEKLSCEQNAVTVPPTATKAEFQIKCNTAWTVSTAADWIRAFTQGGTDDGILVVEFDPYSESEADRTADIVVSTSKMSITLTVTQTKAGQKEEAVTVTTKQFNEAGNNPDTRYRISGFVDKMVSMKHGSLILRDAFGTALIYCLKTSADGEDGQFGTLGINVGDVITVVGNRSSFGEDAELVNGYHESHKIIDEISISDYITRADGSSVWYRLKGKVADVTDEAKGTLVLADPVTGDQVTVTEVVSDYGAAVGSFADLGVRKGCELTVIASSKANGKVAKSIYVEHAAGKLTPGIMAKWGFNETFVIESSFDKTYTGMQISAEAKLDARCYDNKAGDGGKYIEAAEGEGRMTFVQVDKTSLDPSGDKANRLVYYTAQPGAGGLAVGDYFLFAATQNVTVPAGTQFKFAFVLRPAGTNVRYWMVEFLDGQEWKPCGSLPVQTVKSGDVDYEYNIERATNDENVVEAIGVMLSDNEDVKVRVRVAAPVCPNGSTFSGLCAGEVRFRGENKFSSPYIEIL